MDRLKQLRKAMTRDGVDLVVISPGGYLRWLDGIAPHTDERPFMMLVSQAALGLLLPKLEAESNRDQTQVPFYEWGDTEGPDAALQKLLTDLGCQNAERIAVDETMRADHAALIIRQFPTSEHRFLEASVGSVRMRKTDEEYQLLKENAQIADRAMKAGWSMMRVGVPEHAVAQAVAESFEASGAQPLFGIVGAGANGAMPHYMAGAANLQAGDPVVMDIGGRKHGYCSDITRVASMGAPHPDLIKIHSIVEDAVQAAMAAARPGVEARVVDQAARDVIEKAGYGDYFSHRLGHGLGIAVHEAPYLTGASTTILEEGMVFSIEPGIYLPKRFGVRLEEIVILRADGPEILSDLSRDIHVIDI